MSISATQGSFYSRLSVHYSLNTSKYLDVAWLVCHLSMYTLARMAISHPATFSNLTYGLMFISHGIGSYVLKIRAIYLKENGQAGLFNERRNFLVKQCALSTMEIISGLSVLCGMASVVSMCAGLYIYYTFALITFRID